LVFFLAISLTSQGARQDEGTGMGLASSTAGDSATPSAAPCSRARLSNEAQQEFQDALHGERPGQQPTKPRGDR
jgi:hypothetical protein